MALDDLLTKCEPDTCPGALVVGVQPLEYPEDAFLVIGFDPDTVVAN